MKHTAVLSLQAMFFFLLLNFAGSAQTKTFNYTACRAQLPPLVDGDGNDECWRQASWAFINQPFDGQSLPDSADFYGRYKIVWTPDRLFILMEITDDKLVDNRTSPTDNYWEDDCTEFFIDEDHLPQGHECGPDAFNAFAYHIAAVPRDKSNYTAGTIVDFSSANGVNHVIDLGRDCNTGRALNLDDHVTTRITKNGNRYTWELEFKIFSKNYVENGLSNTPVTLSGGKVMGFAIAYCDDDSGRRDNMIGTIPNHNDYSGPYPFYRFTNEYGTLTLDNNSSPTSVNSTRSKLPRNFTFCKTPVQNNLEFTDQDLAREISELKIINISGKVLLKTALGNGTPVNINGISPGIYLLEVNSLGKIYRQKIVKL